MRPSTFLVLTVAIGIFASGCSTLNGPRGKKRIMAGALAGAGVGSMGGAILSPNDESRGLNALIFGLSGAVLGGGLAVLIDNSTVSDTSHPLHENERSLEQDVREFQVAPSKELPSFLKGRIQPLIVEEYTEADSVSEDGTLHEPHKAYRIKRQGELFSRPVSVPVSGTNAGERPQ